MDLYKFIEILFVCLRKKDTYGNFKDMLWNFCLSSHKLLFNAGTYHFLFKKYSCF
jgi:hypothetical protein